MSGKTKNNIRLGKGLNALIRDTQPLENRSLNSSQEDRISFISVESIQPNPYQPRQDFPQDTLKELMDSIRENGLIQPITVRSVDNGYQIIAGERRLRASQAIKLKEIPAYIIKVDTKEELLEFAIIENVQREKLNPIDLAQSYQRLIEECHLTQDQVAHKIGKERSTVTNILRLLKLEDYIKDSLKEEIISMGHARALLGIENPDDRQKCWKKSITQNWSVRKLEQEAKKNTKADPFSKKNLGKVQKTVHHKKVEEKFRDAFGTQVRIYPKKLGGSIEIEYYSNEDLERLLEIINSIKY